MSKNKAILLSILLVLLVFGIWVLAKQRTDKKSPTTAEYAQTRVGGDRDQHGCIGSAGYSWDSYRAMCVRPWEETDEAVVQEIGAALAQKYSKPASEVHITLNKRAGSFASGAVRFGNGGTGEAGMFLALFLENSWQVAFDGNGSVNCTQMRQQYQFPDEILKPNFCD